MSEAIATPESATVNGMVPSTQPIPSKRDEVLYCGPFHAECIRDMVWAEAQYQRGEWDQYIGLHIAVYKEQVWGIGRNYGQLQKQARFLLGS
jgi:hypothetical protein